MSPMKPKEILKVLKTLNQEQSELFLQLQLDSAKLDGEIEGLKEAKARFERIYEPNQ